jgi:hypothetical protein
MGYWRVKDGPQGFMLQGGKMQGSSGSTEIGIFFVCLCIFVYYAWEITRMRSGSDEQTSSLVSPCLGKFSETLVCLARPWFV